MNPRRLTTVALALSLTLLASASTAPQRWAVLVGVNDYIEYGDEPGGDLKGSEADTRLMQDVLGKRWGIPESNMHVLLSRAATKAAIKAALTEWLPARVRAGDLVVFYFSGHGSQASDKDGDESDGLDETICPADVKRRSTENDIRDDELGAWIRGLPTRDVVVILDSCHSGTATRALREAEDFAPRSLGRDIADTEEGTARDLATSRALAAAGGASQESATDDKNVIELSAAAAHQLAMEATFPNPTGIGGHRGGAFTTHLVRQLWQATPAMTYEQVFGAVVNGLKADRFTQDPQISGPKARPLLRTAAPAPTQIAAADQTVVRAILRGQPVLSAGSVRGVTVGSLYQAASGAILKVDSVRPEEALTTIANRMPAPKVGETAKLLAVSMPEPRLRVDATRLSRPLRNGLLQQLAGFKEIDFVSAQGGADLYLRPGEAGRVIEVFGRDGRLRETHSLGAGTDQLLVKLVKRDWAIKQLAALENPGAPFRVELSLAGEKRAFKVGEVISFKVRTEKAGYLTLIDFSTDGNATVIYPNAYMDLGQLQPNQVVEIPGERAVFTIAPPLGTALVRAVVTAEKLDLAKMAESGSAEEIAAALRTVLQETSMRSIVVSGPRPQPTIGNWATTVVVYEVLP